MRKNLIITFLAGAMAISSARQPFAVYLRNPVSAQDEATGNVFPHFWNSAVVSPSDDIALAGYKNRFGLFNDGFVGARYGFRRVDFFALVQISSVGDLEGRKFSTAEPEYTFSANRANGLLGASFALNRYVRLGVGWRHIYENLELAHFDANTFFAGIAAEYKGASASLSVMDYGADRKYFSYEYPPPTVYSLRTGYEYRDFLRVGGAVFRPDPGNTYGALGIEFKPTGSVTLAGSYTIAHDSRGFALGGQFALGKFALGYSCALMGNLGVEHSVSLYFGR